jgi:hypothetical protein
MKAGIGVNAVTNELTITIQGASWEAIWDAGFCEGEAEFVMCSKSPVRN